MVSFHLDITFFLNDTNKYTLNLQAPDISVEKLMVSRPDRNCAGVHVTCAGSPAGGTSGSSRAVSAPHAAVSPRQILKPAPAGHALLGTEASVSVTHQ